MTRRTAPRYAANATTKCMFADKSIQISFCEFFCLFTHSVCLIASNKSNMTTDVCLFLSDIFRCRAPSFTSSVTQIYTSSPVNQGTVDVQASKFHVAYSVLAQAGYFASTSSPAQASLLMMATTMVILCRRWIKNCR